MNTFGADGCQFRRGGGAGTLLRCSGTEPVVRVCGEAENSEYLSAILSDTLREVHYQ